MAAKADKKASSAIAPNKEDLTPSSNITYNSEVVAIIAGLAANEVEGIAGMCSVSGSLMSKNRNITRGVKVEVGTEEVAVDLYVIVEYGIPIQRAAADAQENVRKAIESMTGLHVVRVDVHVQSVSFEQEKKALQAGAQNAALAAGDAEAEQAKLPEQESEKKAEKQPAAQPEKKEEPVSAPKAKHKDEPKTEPVTEAKAETKADVKAEAKAETKTEPKAEPRAKSEPKGKAAKADRKEAAAETSKKNGEKKPAGDDAPAK